jgi:hypothetical protein
MRFVRNDKKGAAEIISSGALMRFVRHEKKWDLSPPFFHDKRINTGSYSNRCSSVLYSFQLHIFPVA